MGNIRLEFNDTNIRKFIHKSQASKDLLKEVAEKVESSISPDALAKGLTTDITSIGMDEKRPYIDVQLTGPYAIFLDKKFGYLKQAVNDVKE